MNLTHFERVLKGILSYDQEGRGFAQRTIQKGEEPARALADFVLQQRRKIGPVRSDKELIAAIHPLSSRALCYAHHLTMELMRNQVDQFSMSELTASKSGTFGGLMVASVGSEDQRIINSSGHMHYQMAAHRLAGKKTYSPSAGLAEQLRHTELRGLTADDLHLPHPSIYILVPEEADLKIWNTESGWHKVVGLYVTEEASTTPRSWRFLVCGEPKPIQLLPGLYDDNDALIYFHVPLPEKMPLTDALAQVQEETTKELENLKKKDLDTFSPMLDKWQEIFRWAMNVVLYASMEGAEAEEVVENKEANKVLEQMRALPAASKKRKALADKLSRTQLCQRISLGKSVTAHRGGWQLTVRVRVIGHWRNQPYGPGRMLRRLQWIEPYWKGPDVGAVENTTAEVAPPTQETGGTGRDESRNRESAHGAGGSGDPEADAGSRSPDQGHGDREAQGGQEDA